MSSRTATFLALNLFAIVLLGIASSYTDIKKGLIENRFVFPAIALAFVLNFLNGFSFEGFLLNGFLAFLFGFILWLAHFWNAGDSKLFLAFALLFPLSLYTQTTMFPAFSILINSFVPAFIVLLAFVLVKTTKAEKKKALAESLNKETIFSIGVFLFSFNWIFFYFFSFFSLQLDFFSITILLFVLVSISELLFPKKTVYVFSVIALAMLVLNFNATMQPDFLLRFFSWLFLFLFLIFFVLKLGISAFGKKVFVTRLKPGMVLLDSVIEKGPVLKRIESFYPSLVNILFWAKEPKLISSGEALSPEQVKMLKKKHAEGKTHFDQLLVQETLPFAPILFVGMLITAVAAFL